MIDQQLVETNKQRLEQEKSRLQKLLSKVLNDDGTVKYPDFGNQDDENASEFAEYETNIAEDYDLEEKLELVEQALQKISDGSYGLCEIGGEEISASRLEAVPEAATCVEHA